jgi:hypothetical protein
VGIGGSLDWHPALEDDLLGLLDLEDRAFDPVREVRLEEGEQPFRIASARA